MWKTHTDPDHNIYQHGIKIKLKVAWYETNKWIITDNYSLKSQPKTILAPGQLHLHREMIQIHAHLILFYFPVHWYTAAGGQGETVCYGHVMTAE